jgi:2-polyprenyl-3-methyl-5-hydroxy-6-metoxy-1,4-benzoquinol methylase
VACLKASHDIIDDSLYKTGIIENHVTPVRKCKPPDYFMENEAESIRLEVKTRPEAVRKQALWSGLKPGLRVLDAGCGPGKVTSILHEMIQPGGTILGVDYSEKRIDHAKKHYGQKSGIDFQLHDLRDPLEGVGQFDLIWVRFMLEYNLVESPEIVRNLTGCLKPDGYLCLLDLDHNCLSYYQLPPKMEKILFNLMTRLEKEYNFDPYSGRKLYAYLYDLGYQNIQIKASTHNLIFGKVKKEDLFNWTKKVEVASIKAIELFENYSGGCDGFFADFINFFEDPRRFTYTPLILCKGMKPVSD